MDMMGPRARQKAEEEAMTRVLDWFIHTDDKPPQHIKNQPPWKRIFIALEAEVKEFA
jgi:hypothetical protein